jgi:superfamily II DNA/RNA helicase
MLVTFDADAVALLQGLFSATQTQEVEHLARAGLRNPLRVGVKVQTKGAQVKNQKIPLTYDALHTL